jgi:hypothetical protein
MDTTNGPPNAEGIGNTVCAVVAASLATCHSLATGLRVEEHPNDTPRPPIDELDFWKFSCH